MTEFSFLSDLSHSQVSETWQVFLSISISQTGHLQHASHLRLSGLIWLVLCECDIESSDLALAWPACREKGPVDTDCRAMSSLSPVSSLRNSN